MAPGRKVEVFAGKKGLVHRTMAKVKGAVSERPIADRSLNFPFGVIFLFNLLNSGQQNITNS